MLKYCQVNNSRHKLIFLIAKDVATLDKSFDTLGLNQKDNPT